MIDGFSGGGGAVIQKKTRSHKKHIKLIQFP